MWRPYASTWGMPGMTWGMYMAGRSTGGGYEVVVLLEMLTVGAPLLWRTRLTSRAPSASQRSTVRTKKVLSMSLASMGLPVAASHTIRRTHGGGVMGRRSWRGSVGRRRLSGGEAHLVAEAAHARADGLLLDDKPTRGQRATRRAQRLTHRYMLPFLVPVKGCRWSVR